MFKSTVSYKNDFSQYSIIDEDNYTVVNIEFFGEIEHYPSAKEIKEHMINVLENFGYDWNNTTRKITVKITINVGTEFWETSKKSDQYYTAIVNKMTLDENNVCVFIVSKVDDTRLQLETCNTMQEKPIAYKHAK